jgi:putative two-component system response regulator
MPKREFKHARIFIVDDEPTNIFLLQQILSREGYTRIQSMTDPREVFSSFAEMEPDLILLDLMMPDMSGYEVLERLERVIPEGTYLPILVLTADGTDAARKKALSSGATDFLNKPLDIVEVVLRVRNLLQARLFHLHLRDQNRDLEQEVLERTRELEESQIEVLIRLAQAGEYRDDTTGQHTRRVGHISALLAQTMGLPPSQVTMIRQTAPLHDVGKIGITDQILLKPSSLSHEEFETMKTHTIIGAKLLGGGSSDLMRMAEQIALSHHENWDGSGYPNGLSGEAIPRVGRIVKVADSFDALTHARPYKGSWSLEETQNQIAGLSGQQYDPQVVEAFLKLHLESLI